MLTLLILWSEYNTNFAHFLQNIQYQAFRIECRLHFFLVFGMVLAAVTIPDELCYVLHPEHMPILYQYVSSIAAKYGGPVS